MNPKREIISWVTCIVASLVLIAVGTIIGYSVDKFELIYKDLNILLPKITVAVITINRFYGWSLFFVFAAGLIIWEVRSSGTYAKIAINSLALILSLAIMALVVIGLFLPLIITIESLGATQAT